MKQSSSNYQYEYLFCDRENVGLTFEVLSFQTSLKEELLQQWGYF